MMRQFELAELVRSYDPHADEDALNRAYVYSMKAHGAQLRDLGRPVLLSSNRGRGHPRPDEARHRLDRDRFAARHG